MALLDTFQAAERTKLARATLARLRVTGGGPKYLKLGSKVLYDEADVTAWIAAQGKRRSTADVPPASADASRSRAPGRAGGPQRAA